MKASMTNIVLIAIIIVMGFFLFRSCQTEEKLVVENTKLASQYEDILVKYKDQSVRVTKQQVAYEVNAKELENEIKKNDSLFAIVLKKQNIKPKVYTRVQQVIKLDTIFIPYSRDSTNGIVKRDSVHLPLSFYQTSPYYTIAGSVRGDGIMLDTLQIPNSITISVVERKRFLRSKENLVYVINSNPYISNVGMQNIVLKERPSFFNRVIKPVLLFGGGLYLGTRIQ